MKNNHTNLIIEEQEMTAAINKLKNRINPEENTMSNELIKLNKV